MAHDTMYLDQWLKTATGGAMTYVLSFATKRIQFRCNRCMQSLTIEDDATLTSTPSKAIDFRLQEFVQEHSVLSHATASGVGAMVNAGFAANHQIDLRPERAAQIKSAMGAYAKELGDKEKQSQKVKALQDWKPGQVIEIDEPKKPLVWEMLNKALKTPDGWLTNPVKQPLPVQRMGRTAPPEPPKPRVLKNIEGRKFR